jgi:poly(3-hydroxybutyrate) depolymerase
MSLKSGVGWILPVLAVAVLLAGCSSTDGSSFPDPVPDECITEVTAGEHQFECSEGMIFDLSVPEACLGSACGLVVDIHGWTMNGKIQDNNTNMRELGRQHGYLVVQPNAPGEVPSFSMAEIPKIYDFVQRVIAAFHLDQERIHIMGFSEGGFLSWWFVCNHSELFASASPGGAGAYVEELDVCHDENSGCQFEGDQYPEHQLDLLILHGTQDVFDDVLCARAQRDAIAAAWEMGTPEEIAGDENYTWTRYQNAQGTVLEYLEHEYTDLAGPLWGHCYPGSTDFELTVEGQIIPYACEEGCAFHWGEVAMDFFRAHPRTKR